VKRGRHEPLDRGPQCQCPISHDLNGFAMGAECPGEAPSCRTEIAARRDEHVDDLTVLINGPVHAAPSSGNFDLGLVDVPTVTDEVPTRHGRIREQWGEALYPAVDGDVIDLDPTLAQKLFDVAVGQPKPQIPTHGQHDDLGREPQPFER
jgi:hypothetical protein